MDLTIKKAGERASIYKTLDAHRPTYDQRIFGYQENMDLRNSPVSGTERYSPLSISSNGSNELSISMYKRQRLPSATELGSSPSDDSGVHLTPVKLQADYYPLVVSQWAHQQSISPTPAIETTMVNTQLIQNGDSIKIDAKKLKLTKVRGTLKLSGALSRISQEKLSKISTYHSNMVRHHPQKQRTAKEQEKRNRNTIACRMSRRLKKLEQIAVEQQCIEHEQQLLQQLEQKLRVNAFLAQLIEMSNAVAQQRNDNVALEAEQEQEIDVVGLDDENEVAVYGAWKYNESVGKIQWQSCEFVATPAPPLVRPAKVSRFSIDYLLGG